MGINVYITEADKDAVIMDLFMEIRELRIQLASAKRTIRELDLSTPEGASRLIGIATTLDEDEDEGSDDGGLEDSMRSMSDDG